MSTENLLKKWQPILEHAELPKIEDNHRKAVTAQLLENQEIAAREQAVYGGGAMLSLIHI